MFPSLEGVGASEHLVRLFSSPSFPEGHLNSAADRACTGFPSVKQLPSLETVCPRETLNPRTAAVVGKPRALAPSAVPSMCLKDVCLSTAFQAHFVTLFHLAGIPLAKRRGEQEVPASSFSLGPCHWLVSSWGARWVAGTIFLCWL